LYGPPGTGKSSLSFAIAGYFRLKIYIVSLNSPAMNEENLGTLFADLPKKCLVLLEDIDTAGLTHTRDEKPTEEVKPAEILPGSGTTVVTTNGTNSNTGRISLSALLNILDGVASQEGRVLVMTTNHIDKLDEALIRPGRVDMKIKFDLASTDMIVTIFRAIFATIEGDIPKTAKSNGVVIRSPQLDSAESKTADKQSVEDAEKEAEAARVAEEKRLAEEARISQLGQQFAELIPTMTFSPAEIQGYLLKNKRDPEVAIKNAEVWVKNTLSAKEKEEQEEREKEAKEEAERQKAEKEKAVKEKAEKQTSGEAVNGEEEKGQSEGKKA
jgi:mitochondrial chaperone BCS1